MFKSMLNDNAGLALGILWAILLTWSVVAH